MFAQFQVETATENKSFVSLANAIEYAEGLGTAYEIWNYDPNNTRLVVRKF